jgi:hypothetical protein
MRDLGRMWPSRPCGEAARSMATSTRVGREAADGHVVACRHGRQLAARQVGGGARPSALNVSRAWASTREHVGGSSGRPAVSSVRLCPGARGLARCMRRSIAR